jgi:hypothetical protein
MMLSSISDTEPMSKNDCVINAARYLIPAQYANSGASTCK